MLYVTDYIEKGHLYCDTKANGSCKSVASDMCGYMNDCNGNGLCNSYGKCKCSEGFFGADCLTTVTDISSVET